MTTLTVTLATCSHNGRGHVVMGLVAVRRILVGSVISSLIAIGFLGSPLGAVETTWTCNGVLATLVGTPGDDLLTGTDGADVIVARQGDDTIDGLGGDDIVCAGKGDDTVYGGGGFDVIFGAQGNDFLYAANGSTKTLRADTKGARMFGGAGNDMIYGSIKWDRMQGGPGNDKLMGFEGRDWLRAGPNNDVVDGGAGIDDQHGGNGRDTISVTNGDIVRGGAGLDLCRILNGQPALFRSCGRNVREMPPAPPLVLSTCTNTNGELTFQFPATGLVTNNTANRRDASIDIDLIDANGTKFGEAFAVAESIEPGETTRWEAITREDIARTASCETRVELVAGAAHTFPGATFNVTIASCVQGVRQVTATGQITNTTGAVADLFVNIHVFDQNGVRLHHRGLDFVEGVQPGQTVDFVARLRGDLPPGQISRCTAFVDNFDA